ncbi:DUF4113 domain-containing protein [Pseudomonas baetica]
MKREMLSPSYTTQLDQRGR